MSPNPQITFVACLPRSRSAWVANLLTHGGSFAYHEPMRWDPTWKPGRVPDFQSLARQSKATRVSFCDTAFGAYWREALEANPDARVLILWRPQGEVREDWNNAVLRWDMATLHDDEGLTLARLDRWLCELAAYCDTNRRNALQIPARMLDKLSTVETVWNFCAPGWAFDKRRALMLMDLNIEAILPRYIAPGSAAAPDRMLPVDLNQLNLCHSDK